MGSVGYTSGARHPREFIWGRNLKKSKDLDEHHHYRVSCYFAHIWTLIKQILPEEVIADFSEAIVKLGGIEMDAEEHGKGDGVLRYKFFQNGVGEEYETSTLAPPSGAAAKNYCR